MAGDPRLTRLLLGLGLRCFSMHSASLLSVKQQLLKADVSALSMLVQKILKTTDEEKLEGLLTRLT